jgi:nicotinamide riboside kinase
LAGLEEESEAQMRIAIAGASGTGKTTLARAIAEKYGLPINPVGARSVALEMGFDNPYDVDAAGKRVEFQRRLFEAKRDWELAHDSFVTDRSYLDNLTYCALHMAEYLEDDAIPVFKKAMKRYDFVVRLWIADFQQLGDRVRKKSVAYHGCYEYLLTAFLSSTKVPICDPRTTDRQERIDRVSRFVDIYHWMSTT